MLKNKKKLIHKLESIKNIPYNNGPNGGFTLHLPDAEGYSNHNITEQYLETLRWLKSNRLYSFLNKIIWQIKIHQTE